MRLVSPVAKRFVVISMVVAVTAIHMAGVAHGGIEPESFGLTRDGQLRLSDFSKATVFLSNDDDGNVSEHAQQLQYFTKDWNGLAKVIREVDDSPDALAVSALLAELGAVPGSLQIIAQMTYFHDVPWEAHQLFIVPPPPELINELVVPHAHAKL